MTAKINLALMIITLILFSTSSVQLSAEEGVSKPSSQNNLDDETNAELLDLSSNEEKTFTRQESLIASLTIFVLAVFVGFEIITKVPPTLHTPLMSGSNAISGITVVGALLAAGFGQSTSLVALLGMLAVALAMINVVGGFLVTHRMLQMFQRKK